VDRASLLASIEALLPQLVPGLQMERTKEKLFLRLPLPEPEGAYIAMTVPLLGKERTSFILRDPFRRMTFAAGQEKLQQFIEFLAQSEIPIEATGAYEQHTHEGEPPKLAYAQPNTV
jgi:hypothetical protein